MARVLHALSGSPEANEILLELESGSASPGDIALLRLARGQSREALDALERSVEEDPIPLSYLGVDPFYDPLRDEPRFQALVRAMTFAPAR